ncbi:hypothetical protein M5K25_020880 [Dendrobium thyrsiflorum]|uniref:Uncharacterized protein n=1 Tax=Dendrobium thyrsiflorum TaxID=117978 RepID=A0ABD0UBP9_DENTH
MARSNEIFRCCIHSWAHLEDCTLWNTYGEVITIPSCTDEAGLNEEGWRFLQRRFMQQVGHLPPINIMKARILEIRRRQDGSFELIVDNPTADINHCILYRKWHPAADTFLVNTYENLIYWPAVHAEKPETPFRSTSEDERRADADGIHLAAAGGFPGDDSEDLHSG